jgi:mannose-6-phosphate isomerase-like protein (cupin superfamily)
MQPGDVVWNPVSGEKALIVESAESSDGAHLVVDLAVEPGGFVSGGEHVHDHCAEHFEVQAGRIAFELNGEARTFAAGERTTVEPGTRHRWWNAGEGEVRARVTVEPALRFEDAILSVWGLCADGHANAVGRPSVLYGALVATRFRREARFHQPPDAIQRLLFPSLAALARRRGLEQTLDRYLDLDAHPAAARGAGALPERISR